MARQMPADPLARAEFVLACTCGISPRIERKRTMDESNHPSPAPASSTGLSEPHEAQARFSVRTFGLTDRGKVRETNEDQFLIAALIKALQVRWTSLPQPADNRSPDESYLFVVADGMGGRAAGERASALAIESVESFVLESLQWFAHCQGEGADKVLMEFQKSLREASIRVRSEAAEHPELRGMGTTLTLALSVNDVLYVAHVGDSRCYLGRDGSLFRLTRDHTLVEEMVRGGQLSAEEAKHHHWRHIITNALGGAHLNVKVEVHKLRLQAGDFVMLSSDGLTEMLTDEVISQVIRAASGPEQACRELVARANSAGGKDNITVVVANFDDANPTDPSCCDSSN
jgi:PPM family protein phosphatase